MPAAAHISTHTVETHRMQFWQMLPANFHSSTIQVLFFHARTQMEQAAAAAEAAAAVSVCFCSTHTNTHK